MHQTLLKIQQELEQLIAQIRSSVPNDEPFGSAHGNWSFPGLTRAELIEEVQAIADQIKDKGGDSVGSQEARLKDYARRLQHLRQQTVPQLWGSSAQAVPAFMFTLDGLRKALAPALLTDGRVEAAAKMKKLPSRGCAF